MSRFRRYVPPAAVALLHLDAPACRWPIGDVADPAFRFCPAKRERGSYCAAHAQLARRR